MTDPIRVCLLGYGFAGKVFHAPLITSLADMTLAKVVERRSAHSQARYPWVKVVGDIQDLYDDETIDLIVVTTPSTNHYEFVRDALMAGPTIILYALAQ